MNYGVRVFEALDFFAHFSGVDYGLEATDSNG